MPGYPIVPAVFILAVVWFVLNALVNEPVPTMATFALILAGIPVYVVCFRKVEAARGRWQEGKKAKGAKSLKRHLKFRPLSPSGGL